MWWALQHLKVPECLVSVIQAMYAKPTSEVHVNNVFSGSFSVGVGVHQGSVLSPLLFVIVLEALSRTVSGNRNSKFILRSAAFKTSKKNNEIKVGLLSNQIGVSEAFFL